jgi:CRP-like cAMP-binding protein
MLAEFSHSPEDAEPSIVEALRKTIPFAGLTNEVLAAIAEASSSRRYAAGETLYAMGQFDGSEFLVVFSGRLKAAYSDAGAGAMFFESVRAGEAFGIAEATLGDDLKSPSGVTISAEADCEIAAIDAEMFRQVILQRRTLTRALMLHFARKSLGQTRASEESSPERRVFAILATLVERDAVTAEWKISKMPKHRDLADKAGVEEADAANAVAKLIRNGVARRNYPGLIIDEIAVLTKLSR